MIFGDEDLHSDLRMKLLNVTKMSVYVAVEFLKSFQEKIDKTYSLVIDKVMSFSFSLSLNSTIVNIPIFFRKEKKIPN